MIARLLIIAVAPLLAVPVLLGGLTSALSQTGIAPVSATCTGGTGNSGGQVAGLDPEQTQIARVIVAQAATAHLPRRAAVIALATADTEAGLHNPEGGDRDSIGVFQQRPSQGWGTPAQLHDPSYAARAFYRRLAAIPNWQTRPLAQVAQAVQRSATPTAYARAEPKATDIADALTHACAPSTSATGSAKKAIDYALAQRGKPYAWGATGPDTFDCSGLVMRAWQHAGVHIPRTTYAQWRTGRAIPRDRLQPGDLVFFNTEPRPGPDHVGLYLGTGRMIQAPHTGDVVKISDITTGYYRTHYLGARRP